MSILSTQLSYPWVTTWNDIGILTTVQHYSVYTARLRYFRLHVRHLDVQQNDTVDYVGDGTIEKPTS